MIDGGWMVRKVVTSTNAQWADICKSRQHLFLAATQFLRMLSFERQINH